MMSGERTKKGFYFNCVSGEGATASDACIETMISRLWQIENAYHTDEDAQRVLIEDRDVIHLWDQQGALMNGHYQLPIPFKSNLPKTPDNLVLAKLSLHGLKRRLQRDEDLRQRYTEEMRKLVDKGYAEHVLYYHGVAG